MACWYNLSCINQPQPGTTPCNQAKCGTCPFICTNTNVTGPKSQINITKQFNCPTYNIAYVIHCTKCTQLYIGETGRTFDTHFEEYLADIKHCRDKRVANHFNQTDHTIHNIRVKGLWLLFTDSVNDRKDTESHLTHLELEAFFLFQGQTPPPILFSPWIPTLKLSMLPPHPPFLSLFCAIWVLHHIIFISDIPITCHCQANILPSTGQKNNTAQPKKISYFASHLIFQRLTVP